MGVGYQNREKGCVLIFSRNCWKMSKTSDFGVDIFYTCTPLPGPYGVKIILVLRSKNLDVIDILSFGIINKMTLICRIFAYLVHVSFEPRLDAQRCERIHCKKRISEIVFPSCV